MHKYKCSEKKTINMYSTWVNVHTSSSTFYHRRPLQHIQYFYGFLLDTATNEHIQLGRYRYKIVFSVEPLTQGVECGDVLPHVIGLIGTGLPHESVHIMSEAEAWHLRWVHIDCEQVLVAAQVHLRRGAGLKSVHINSRRIPSVLQEQAWDQWWTLKATVRIKPVIL